MRQFSPTSNPTRGIVPQTCPYTYSGSIEYFFNNDDKNGAGTFRYDLVRESSPGAGDGVLCGRLEVTDKFDGWVAWGFSTDGFMNGPISPLHVGVIGRIDDGTVKKYTLNQATGVTEMAPNKQTLLDTSIEVKGDDAVMTFTKLLKEDGEVEIVDGLNRFISAKGDVGGAVLYHNINGRQPNIVKDFSEDVVCFGLQQSFHSTLLL